MASGRQLAGFARVAIAAALCCAAAGALAAVLMGHAADHPLPGVVPRTPGLDKAPVAGAPAVALDLRKVGKLVVGDGRPSSRAGEWPCFRGPNLDGASPDASMLSRAWPAAGPPRLWAVPIGDGYAGAAVSAGRVYLADYDAATRADLVRCLSLDDGAEIWRFSYPVKVKRNHGMSRTVPAVRNGCVVSLGPKCHVVCLDAATGEFKWGVDLVAEYGTEVPQWYAGQCPLIDGDRVVLAPAGPQTMMVALDLRSGAVVWRAPNPRGWAMTHSSIVPIDFAGRRQYVYCAGGGVLGVDADDGRILWDTDAWSIRIATIASPVPSGDGRIFLSGGYNAGAMMLRLRAEGDTMSAAPAFAMPAADFGSTQQTPILRDGYIYGVRPDGQLACVSLEGAVMWTSGPARRFGLGPYTAAGDLLYVMNDDGHLTLVQLNPRAFTPLADAQVLTGRESWGPMALAGDRLLVRDFTELACLDVGVGARDL